MAYENHKIDRNQVSGDDSTGRDRSIHLGDKTLSDILLYPELATALGISERTLKRLVSKEQIPHKKIGKWVRFYWPDIEAWLRNGKAAKA